MSSVAENEVGVGDVEPVAAFFPSIDRNLMRDLDRHLRGSRETAETSEAQDAAATEAMHGQEPDGAVASFRPDIAGVVEAVEQAASSMAAMSERIQVLEAQIGQYESANHHLTVQLGEAIHTRDGTEAALRSERERGQRVEAFAAHHVSRATKLERELDVARGDLAKVVEAITHALGSATG